MAIVTHHSLDQLQTEVNRILNSKGAKSQMWHSGGGIFGVFIDCPNGDNFFTTLDSDSGGYHSVVLDWNDSDGEVIAGVYLDSRPWGHPKFQVSSAQEIADDIYRLVSRVR
jgi:hypothetical protein